MLKGWLIYNQKDAQRNEAYIKWFLEEAKDLDVELSLLLKEDLTFGIAKQKLFCNYRGEAIAKPDFAIVRNRDALFSEQLELMAIRTFNSSKVSRICNDKARTHQYLAGYEIPMLDTVFWRAGEFSEYKLAYLNFPIVVKTVAGHGGQEVYQVKNEQALRDLLNTLASKDLILQAMGQAGRDVRVFVVGKEIVGAVLRQSEQDFRSNYSLGGQSQLYDLSLEQRELVHKVIDAFDELAMVGVDFIFDQEGRFVLNEIEDVVGSRTLSLHSDVNIVRKYLLHIMNCVMGSKKVCP
ncbi:ATP-grasp domain-containing protein [Heliorestis acidaminivorans]|nr:ATP-grasp domain-containing protein [Heliorestis acidaminivorans]